MSLSQEMFSELVNTESRWLRLLKRGLLVIVVIHLVIGPSQLTARTFKFTD
jgi:hypothetical protein